MITHTITFTVPTIPVAQPRQRHRVLTTGGRTFAHNYTPQNSPVNAYKAAVQLAAREAYSGPPHDGPVRLFATFVFPRPKALRWKTKPMPVAKQTSKPDIDNLVKALTDALNGLVFVDDARIYAVTAMKLVAAGDEQPRCEVRIELEEQVKQE